MLLFKPELVPLILSGRKTQTRRVWRSPPVRRGRIYLAKTELLSRDWFARLEILDLRKERLGDITPDSVHAEGYDRIEDFQAIWRSCYSRWIPSKVVDVVEFRVIESNPQFQARNALL